MTAVDQPTAVEVTGLRTWIGEHVGEMLADLRAYVEIETPSDDLDALARGREWVTEWVTSRLGPPSAMRTEPGAGFGDTCVLDYPARPGAGAAQAPVALLAHYDTVWPLGTLAEIPFAVKGDVITGPGVFDMKAGLVQAVWAVRALSETGLPHPPLRLVLNGDEEVGSPASRPVIEESCQGTAAVLVFEASAGGAVKTARKGVGLYDITLTGVEAHAGLDPTAGASAVAALGQFIVDAAGLTDLDAGTTVNVGVVAGGTRRNVTAGRAQAGVDVRASVPAEADRVDAALRAWRPPDGRVGVAVDGGLNRPVMARTAPIAELFERARTLANPLGLDLAETAVGGASDGNFAAAMGCAVLDGLGAVGAGAHARDEHATVSGVVERASLAAALLASLAWEGA